MANKRSFEDDLSKSFSQTSISQEAGKSAKRFAADSAHPHKCEFEDYKKSFKPPCDLARNMISHSDDRPHKCTFEDFKKSFKLPCDLPRHMSSHSDDRPHKCTFEDCTMAFKTKGVLTEHMLRHSG